MFAKSSAPKTPALIMISVMFLIFAVAFGTLGVMRLGEKPVVDAATVKYSDFSTENEYSFSDLILVDVYAEFWEDDEDNIVGYNYVVLFADSTGELCYASLEVPNSSDISKTCLDYIKDEKLDVRDVILSGCFSCYDLDKQDENATKLFSEIYSHYNADFAGGVKTNLHFKYDAANAEEFAENRKAEATIFIIAGAIFFIVSAVIITLIVVSFKKAKKLSDVVTEGYEAPNLMMNQSAPDLMTTQDESAEENKEE